MSKFTGRQDFYDELMILGDGDIRKGFEQFKGTKLYVTIDADAKHKQGSKKVKLDEMLKRNRKQIEYESLIDIAKYFPYLIQIMCLNDKDQNNNIVVLTKKPQFDLNINDRASYFSERLKEDFNSQLEKWYSGEEIV